MVLTKEQSKVVNSPCKINICKSVPGSGKSTVLIARAERLWRETKEPILIVTFSNEACNNIVRKISPESKSCIVVKTIHSFCYDVVKHYWKELNDILGGDNWPNEPKIVTKDQELKIMAEVFPTENAPVLYEVFSYLRGLATSPDQILRLFKKKVYFDRVRQTDIEKYMEFEKIRLSKGFINFDDMVDLAEHLIPLPFVATELSRKYSHILIDEAQDTSDQQWRILRPLVLNSMTSLVVGDYNQSIYGWRNADGSILLNMAQMKGAVTFRLSQSFRSGSLIAALANKICYDKTSQIVPQDHLGSVKVVKFENTESEVEWVLKNVDKDTAIISRTNSYLEKFERVCVENDIYYQGKSFYRSNHINDLYKFVIEFTGSNVISIIEKAYINNNSYLKTEIDDFKLVVSLINKEGLPRFIDLVGKSLLLDGTGVTLTTGHASKGLEWKRVYVVGCHSGHVPHRASNDDREERNLFYVMTTRAMGELILTCQVEPSVFIPTEVRKHAISITN